MDKDVGKNFEELLAVFGATGPTPATSASASVSSGLQAPAPAPAPPAPPPVAQVAAPAAAGAPSSGKNYDELFALLGGRGAPPAPAPAAAPVATAPVAPRKAAPALVPVPAVVPPTVAAAAPAPASASSGAQMDIAAELAAAISAASVRPAVKPAVAAPAVPAAKVAPVVKPSASAATPGQQARPVQRTPQQITHEQVIVGHFCRHAIKTLGRVMNDMPGRAEMEERLKVHIKSYWAQWVRGTIVKQRLLDSVAAFVRASCPQAAAIDVVNDFRRWYQKQLEIQNAKLRANPHLLSEAQKKQRMRLHQQEQLKHAQQAALAVANRSGAVGTSMAGGAAGKSVASKSVPPRVAQGRDGAAAGKGVANKSVAGKTIGRVGAANVAAKMKIQPARPKGPPPKAKGAVFGQGSSSTGGSVPEKRPFDAAEAAAAAKKQKVGPVKAGAKAPAGKKKVAPVSVVTSAAMSSTSGKGLKPPVPRPGAAKGQLQKTGSSAGVATGGAAVGAAGRGPGTGTSVGSGSSAAEKKPRKRVDDELDIVKDIVDIEGEEDMLGKDGVGMDNGFAEDSDFGTGMVLVGANLKNKLESITTRFGLEGGVSADAMEIISLAVKERLSCVIESMKEIAAARTESSRCEWEIGSTGVDMFEKMKQMRDAEERALTVASEMRVRRRKREREKEAAKAAAESGADEKRAKDAAAAAEADRKEKAALEKKRQADSSQRNALSGLVAGFSKRRKKAASKGGGGLMPLAALGKGSASGLGSSATAGGAGGSSEPAGIAGGVPGSAGQNAGVSGPARGQGAPGAGGDSRAGATKDANGGSQSLQVDGRPCAPLTLRDCLFFMENERCSRKSTLLYKWYSRLNTTS